MIRARNRLVLLVLALAACDRQRGSDPFTLQRNLESCQALEIEVDPGEAEAIARLAAERVVAAGRWRIAWAATGAARDDDAARVLFCGPEHPDVPALLAYLDRAAPQTGAPDLVGTRILERLRAGSDVALVATIADSDRPGLPLTFALARTSAEAARLLPDLTPCARPGWRLFDAGELIGEGGLWHLPQSSAPPVIELATARAQQAAAEVVTALPGLELRAEPLCHVKLVQAYGAEVGRALEQVSELLLEPGDAVAAPLIVHLHASLEAHQRMASASTIASTNPATLEVHALLSPFLFDDDGAEAARAAAVRALGPPRAAWLLDGIGLAAAGTYWKRPLDEWVAHVSLAGLAPAVGELMRAGDGLSPHATLPLRAFLVRFLYETRGRKFLRALWRGESQLEPDAALRSAFLARLAKNSRQFEAELSVRREQRHASAVHRPFRRGVHLVAPKFDARMRFRGLGTSSCANGITSAKRLGADAIALDWWTWTDPGLPDFAGDGATSESAASASDLELAATAAFARRMGLVITMRPLLLSTRSSNWAGWMLLNSPEHWQRLFDGLTRVAVHYGLLSELCNADVFCFAGGMPDASATMLNEHNKFARAELPGRRERWLAIARKARAAFTGGLTYCAESGYEAKNLEFWHALDFLGFELYPEIEPLDKEVREYSRERAAQAMLGSLLNYANLARSIGLPPLVVETGFSSTTDGWRDPTQPSGVADPDDQRRLIESLADALQRASSRGVGFAGLFLWYWSTDQDAGGIDDRGYTLQRKTSAEAIQALFRVP